MIKDEKRLIDDLVEMKYLKYLQHRLLSTGEEEGWRGLLNF